MAFSPMNRRLQELEQAILGVRQGEWSNARFAAYLEQLDALVSQQEATLQSLALPSPLPPSLELQLRHGHTGLVLWKEGLDCLWGFAQASDEALLAEGLDMICEADRELEQAYRENLAFRNEIEEPESGSSISI